MAAILDNAFLARGAFACLTILAAWALAASLRWLLLRAGRTDRIATIMARSGFFAGWLDPSAQSIRDFAGRATYWSTLSVGIAIALATLSREAAERLSELGWIHLPKLLLAAVVLGLGQWLAGYGSAANEGLRFPWRWAAAARAGTLFTGVALASELTGIATLLIRSAYLIVLAGCVLLLVLALAPLFKAHFASHASETQPDSVDQIR
jgi:hypothetical protein